MGYAHFFKLLTRIVMLATCTTGVAALAVAAMIAVPPRTPPELPSISVSARAIDRSNLPPLQRFQARDGTELSYRLYATSATPRRGVILIHGSSGHGAVMNMLARSLSTSGILVVTPDMRGHGASGTRGDIAYIGQLEDDVEDMLAHLRQAHGQVAWALAGHSAGGGFTLRVASSPKAELFDHYILLAPYLGPFAPTSRPQVGNARWAEPDIPRIIALSMLRRAGITCCEQLPALAFATAPGAELRQTTRYSFRLMSNFGVDLLKPSPFTSERASLTVISGEKDELIDSARFRDSIEPRGRGALVIIPDADHMGLLGDPRTGAEIVKVLTP